MLDLTAYLLVLIAGLFAGMVRAVANICVTLLLVPSGLFLLGAVYPEQHNTWLIWMASVVIGTMPINLYLWMRFGRHSQEGLNLLVKLGPWCAIGGGIGAQLYTIVPLTSLVMLLGLFLLLPSISQILGAVNITREKKMPTDFIKPLAMAIGCLSLMGANSGYSLSHSYGRQHSLEDKPLTGFASGIALFASIAALIGFLFPAISLEHHNDIGTLGLIHWPISLALSVGLLVGYSIIRLRPNQLEHKIIQFSVAIFCLLAGLRLVFNLGF
ncbi:TSUP family transporter [Marinomonas epiphytica]